MRFLKHGTSYVSTANAVNNNKWAKLCHRVRSACIRGVAYERLWSKRRNLSEVAECDAEETNTRRTIIRRKIQEHYKTTLYSDISTCT